MDENVKEVEDAGFAEAIRVGIVLVDFWAPRCGPCRLQMPILEDVAAEIGDNATILKINIDENSLAPNLFDFKSIPTLILFKEGTPVRQMTGLQTKEVLVSAIAHVM